MEEEHPEWINSILYPARIIMLHTDLGVHWEPYFDEYILYDT